MKDKIKDLIDCYSNRLDEIETDLQEFGYNAVRSTKASVYRVIITDLYAVLEESEENMTREEAIKELQESHDMMRNYDIDENESRLMTALNMAIKALEQEQKTGHCRDCKYYHTAWDGTETHYYEDYWCEWVEPNENDFCSLYEAKKEVSE